MFTGVGHEIGLEASKYHLLSVLVSREQSSISKMVASLSIFEIDRSSNSSGILEVVPSSLSDVSNPGDTKMSYIKINATRIHVVLIHTY